MMGQQHLLVQILKVLVGRLQRLGVDLTQHAVLARLGYRLIQPGDLSIRRTDGGLQELERAQRVRDSLGANHGVVTVGQGIGSSAGQAGRTCSAGDVDDRRRTFLTQGDRRQSLAEQFVCLRVSGGRP